MIRALFGSFVFLVALVLVINGNINNLEASIGAIVGLLVIFSGLFAMEARGQLK